MSRREQLSKRITAKGQMFFEAEIFVTESDLNKILEPNVEPFVQLTFKFVEIRSLTKRTIHPQVYSGRYLPESDTFEPALIWNNKPMVLRNLPDLKRFLKSSALTLLGAK